MKMLPVDDIEGMMSFEDAKIDLARLSGLLIETTDDLLFTMRFSSLEAIALLISKYIKKENMARAKESTH